MMDTRLRQLGVKDREIDGAKMGWILVKDRPMKYAVIEDQQHSCLKAAEHRMISQEGSFNSLFIFIVRKQLLT